MRHMGQKSQATRRFLFTIIISDFFKKISQLGANLIKPFVVKGKSLIETMWDHEIYFLTIKYFQIFRIIRLEYIF